LSSKLRKLKQQAYEAGRKRDWAGAAEAYAQILELDKNNPSLLNEYGDLCLKAGDQNKALRQFLAAAAKYKQTGLLNNAQAVYKKVLRHDATNLNANWFLAEIRAAQGLAAEGEKYALTFLAAAEEVSGEIKEIFHKRCLEIFELYPESDAILEKVERTFRMWDMPLETARAGCLRACILRRAGDEDRAAEAIAQLCTRVPELVNYAEYGRWQSLDGQPAAGASPYADVNTIDLGAGPETAAGTQPETAPEPAPAPAAAPDAPRGSAAGDAATVGDIELAARSALDDLMGSGGDLSAAPGGSPGVDAEASDPGAPAGADGVPAVAAEDPAEDPADDLERDEDGCISIDLDGETSFAELLGGLAGGDDAGDDAGEGGPAAPAPAAAAPAGHAGGGTVNLLDEILAEEGDDILRSSDTEQVSTIASEIGRHLGDQAAADPQSQYDQGLVYLEMGLYDQAALAFAAAARDPRHSLRAREMWGLALQRDGRLEDAAEVLEEGLAGAGEDGRAALGLRYLAGRIHEELGRVDRAQEHYRQVHAADAGFADVAQRLRALVG